MRCEDCGGKVIDKQGILVCPGCGLDYGPNIATTAKYYSPTEIEDYAPLTRTGKTVIRPFISAETPAEATKGRILKKADTWSYTSRERHIYRVLQKMRSYCHAMVIPNHLINVIENKYVEAVEKGLTRRYREDVTIASLIFLVCNNYRTPRLIGDICNTVAGGPTGDRRTKSSLHLLVRKMVNEVGGPLGIPYRIENPAAYLWKIGSDAGVPSEVVKKADKFIKKHWQRNKLITGRMPQIVAGAVLAAFIKKYNLPIPLQDISRSCGGTEVSIRKVCQKIEPLLNFTAEKSPRKGGDERTGKSRR